MALQAGLFSLPTVYPTLSLFLPSYISSLSGQGLDLIYLCGSPAPGASLMAQAVKNSPAMQETQVRSLGWEDPLEKEMVTHSSIVAWRIPWTEESGGL